MCCTGEVLEYVRENIRVMIEYCDGVYQPSDDTFLLADNFVPEGTMLEIGSGTGLISMVASIMGIKVTSVDINPAAVDCTRENAIRNGVSLEVYESDLFSRVRNRFDTIVFNPPYLPVEENIPGSEQWAGGKDGFSTVRKFLKSFPDYLTEGGKGYIVLSDLADIGQIMSEFPGIVFTLVASKKLFFERLSLLQIKAAIQ